MKQIDKKTSHQIKGTVNGEVVGKVGIQVVGRVRDKVMTHILGYQVLHQIMNYIMIKSYETD